jgi:hypothetical protein
MKALLGLVLLVSLTFAADSLNCRIVGHCDIPGNFNGIGGAGNILCLAACDSGLYTVNISDPTNPVVVGHCRTPGLSYEVFVDGNYAYLACAAYLKVIDISNPANPAKVGVCTVDTSGSGIACLGVTKVGNYAYIAGWLGGFYIIDVSDPTNPVKVGHCHTRIRCRTSVVKGNYAYIADQDSGVFIANISDPTNPVRVGAINTPLYAEGIDTIDGHYVCDADGTTLRIIDVSDPANPVEDTFYDQTGYAYDITVDHGYGYVAVSRNGLCVMDFSDPLHPKEVGHYDPQLGAGAGWDAIVKVGGYEYVADYYVGLKVVEFYGGGLGVEEGRRPPAYSSQLTATIVRGVLWLRAAASSKTQAPSYLLDAVGRRVMRLRPGPNDVQHLSPGVYFTSSPGSVERLVLTR